MKIRVNIAAALKVLLTDEMNKAKQSIQKQDLNAGKAHRDNAALLTVAIERFKDKSVLTTVN